MIPIKQIIAFDADTNTTTTTMKQLGRTVGTLEYVQDEDARNRARISELIGKCFGETKMSTENFINGVYNV